MADVTLLPYLNLDERARVGAWEIVPKKSLKPEDAVEPSTFALARQHLALYSLPDKTAIECCGCFARPASGKIGDPFDQTTLHALRLSVLGGLLVMNPEQGAANPGMTVSTSENATLYAHPLNTEGSVAVEYGCMMRTLIGGVRAADNPGYIPYPVELHLPMGNQLDADLADALYALLIQKTDESRRLSTTLKWLDVAWRNTDSITSEVRVMALKSGFEVLLDVGDKVEAGRAALSSLLDSPAAARSAHTYKKRTGANVTIRVTDLEWWFTTFAFLRNAIAHGSDVPDADWKFDGKGQVMLAQRQLLEAIRKKVADATGRPSLLMSPLRRRIHEAWDAFFEEHPMGKGGGPEIT